MFVAKPGNGKTISMTEHIERVRKEHPEIKVYTNFNYKKQDGVIKTWKDIVKAPDNSLIAIDEIHMIFGSLNHSDFPVEILGEITQNRHSRKQFITSTQDYDLVNVNFKRVCNFIVLCKNFWGLDRLFINYYFDRGIYESKNFAPDKRKAEFIRTFVASDETYSRYDTLEKIQSMIEEVDYKDTNQVLKLISEIKDSGQLQSKEIKYLSNIQERINSSTAAKDLWDKKDKEIEELKSLVEKLKKIAS
ncbi:Zonular occludens toxin (Zot) [compost metagenome]